MLTRLELGSLTLCGALLSWALWTSVTVERQVAADLGRLRATSAARWTALVETGVPAHQATELVLTELRGRVAGQPTAIPDMAFVPAVDLDRLWQARLLNPFLESGTSAPRNEYERQTLREERNDVRLVLHAATPSVRAARGVRAQQLLAGFTSLALLTVGAIAYRVRSRRRDAMGLAG
jgi:hypothetical protein